MPYTIAQQSDPWQPYGQRKKHPTPEPATYIAIALCVLIVIAARWGRKAQ